MSAEHPEPPVWKSKSTFVFVAFAMIAAGLLAYEHRVHLLGVLPWLLILACPLMHIFMHHGHGHGSHGDHSGRGPGRRVSDEAEKHDA